MASDKSYLDYILSQLAELPDVGYRPMMGEYVLYYNSKVIGGIYDNRFLVKPTKNACRVMQEMTGELPMDLPYDGAREMLAVNPEDRELMVSVVEAAAEDLPVPRRKK